MLLDLPRESSQQSALPISGIVEPPVTVRHAETRGSGCEINARWLDVVGDVTLSCLVVGKVEWALRNRKRRPSGRRRHRVRCFGGRSFSLPLVRATSAWPPRVTPKRTSKNSRSGPQADIAPCHSFSASRASSLMSRVTLRKGIFGQHCGLSGHASQSRLDAR